MSSSIINTVAALVLLSIIASRYQVICHYVPSEHMSHYYDPYSFGYDVSGWDYNIL